ncbi:MAG TPA: MaoC/PaaZ C-terminal domain-containing protein [Pseudolabrys sp.]|jgi:acyl dehydratase
MAIDYDKLLVLKIPDAEQSYDAKDCILYALGVGLGLDPVNEDELPFVYEKNLKVLPTLGTVLASPGFWLRELDTGIDWVKLVHGEHSMVMHKPLEGHGTLTSKSRVFDVVDKGEGKGAIVYSERTVSDKASGDLICTIVQTTFCRGDGGFGGPVRPQRQPHAIPERTPDHVCELATRPETALIYRLSADLNPLHADPAVAKAAGFPKPILHGLATFGVAGHAVLKTVCGYDPAKLGSIDGRFSAPVYPGETIRTELWRDGDVVSFRAKVVERDVVAINNGRATLR